MIRKLLKARLLIPSFVMVLAIVAAACGGDDAEAPKAGGQVSPATAEAPATPKPAATSAPAGPEPTRSSAGAFREPTATPLPAGVAAPTPTPRPAGPTGGQAKVETLVLAVDPAAGETNLHWAGSVDHHQQFDLVSEVLVDINPDTNKWVPELAKSWEMSTDGTEFRFQLEEGVPWHTGFDGTDYGEFKAADALHSWAMNQRDDSLLGYVTDWREVLIDQSTILSDHEIILKIKNPNPDYLFYIAPSGAGLMMNKAQWDAGGDDAYEAQIIGTGAYKYTGRTYGVNIEYERVPNHWRRNNPAPDFQKMDLRWIKEAATRNAGLLAGEIHMTELTRDLADSAVDNEGMKIIKSNFPGNQVAGFFTGLYPATPDGGGDYSKLAGPDLSYQDIRVREAMNRAIDKQTIMDTLFAGRVTVTAPLGFYDDLPGWNQDWITNFDRDYGYDPEKAIELLAEAGYGPDNPAKLRGAVMAMFGFPESIDLMQAMEVMFRDVGIEMSLEEWEWSNWLAVWRGQTSEAHLLWLIPPSYKTVYAQISLWYRSSQPLNAFSDEWLDGQFALLQQTVDMGDRDDIQRGIGNYIYDQYALMPMVYIYIEWVVNPNIVDQWTFPGSDGANYGHFDMITACTTPEPCMN